MIRAVFLGIVLLLVVISATLLIVFGVHTKYISTKPCAMNWNLGLLISLYALSFSCLVTSIVTLVLVCVRRSGDNKEVLYFSGTM